MRSRPVSCRPNKGWWSRPRSTGSHPLIEPDRVEAAQQDLLAHAQTLSFTQLQVAANHLVEVVDPDTVDQTLEQQLAAQERKALASAWFTGQYGSDGIARGRFALPNLVFGMLTKHLEASHLSPSGRHRHRSHG